MTLSNLPAMTRGALCALAAVTFAFSIQGFGALSAPDQAAKDAVMRGLADPQPNDQLVEIIGIDQGSLDGVKELTDYSWPWPRAFFANVINVLDHAGAKAIVFDLLFLEDDLERAEFPEGTSDEALGTAAAESGRVLFAGVLREPTNAKNAHNPHPAFRDLGDQACPPWPVRQAPQVASAPVEPIASGAMALAAANFVSDDDGVLRRMTPTYRVGDRCVPYLGLASALGFLAADDGSFPTVTIEPGILRVGARTLPLDNDGRMNLDWHGPGGPAGRAQNSFRYTPVYDVLLASQELDQGSPTTLDLSRFQDKIVLIGSTAPGLMDLKPTPMSEFGPYPGVEVVATAAANILAERALRVPEGPWVLVITLVLALLVGLVTALRENLVWYAVITIGLTALYTILAIAAAASQSLLLPFGLPLFAAMLTGIFALGWQYFYEGQDRQRIRQLFGNYVAAPVVEQLLADPASLQLGGERREMTVLFSDIVGYTSISERLSPEALISQLNEYLTAIGRPIIEHNGYVDKYIGDAVMAIFGAPVAQDDMEVRGVQSALQIQALLIPMQKAWNERGMPALPTRIGLATGSAVLGNIGSSQRVNYTAIGDTVNLAARLEGANKVFGTSILIDEMTASAVKDRVQLRQVGTVAVKGRASGVRVYEPLCLIGEHSELPEAFLDVYQQGVTAFQTQAFKEAVNLMDHAQTLAPEDIPTRMYLERAQHYVTNPPAEGEFDEVLRLTQK